VPRRFMIFPQPRRRSLSRSGQFPLVSNAGCNEDLEQWKPLEIVVGAFTP
jgi:hypothetical protein